METITELEYMASCTAPQDNTTAVPKQMTDSQTETDLQDLVESSAAIEAEEIIFRDRDLTLREDVGGDILPSHSHPFLGKEMLTSRNALVLLECLF